MYYLSSISTSRNINLKKIIKSSFLSFLANFFKHFVFKTYGILKMLILGAQDNFHIILTYYTEVHLKKKIKSEFRVLH